MNARDTLLQRMRVKRTLLCCGLDPDLTKMPHPVVESERTDEDRVLAFCRQVVRATADHVCAYKIQKAFFDLLDGGHAVLRDVIADIHETYPDIPVFLDCKIGDIDNTMEVYTRHIFGDLDADGVVVNPYMGDDVFASLTEWHDRATIVLVRTSNPSSSVVQDATLADGRRMWQYMLDLVVDRWGQSGTTIPVLSANTEIDMAAVRERIPNNMPILLAGVGAQGGHYDQLSKLTNEDNIGVFVNSSRGILYAGNGHRWDDAVRDAAISLKHELNEKARL